MFRCLHLRAIPSGPARLLVLRVRVRLVSGESGEMILIALLNMAKDGKQPLERLGANVVGPVGTLRGALEIVEGRQISVDAALLDIALHGEMVFPVAAVLKTRQIPFAFISGCDAAIIPPSYRGAPTFAKPADWAGIASHLVEEVAQHQCACADPNNPSRIAFNSSISVHRR